MDSYRYNDSRPSLPSVSQSTRRYRRKRGAYPQLDLFQGELTAALIRQACEDLGIKLDEVQNARLRATSWLNYQYVFIPTKPPCDQRPGAPANSCSCPGGNHREVIGS